MENWIRAMFGVWNQILCTGVVFGVLLLLRPLLVRLVTPQQRVWLWYAAWASVVILSTWGIVGRVRVLPVNLWDLLIPRSGGPWESPSLLPSDYDGPGIYTLALPGGGLAPIPLTNEPCFVLTLLYLAGAAALAVWMVRRSLAMKQLGRLGVPLDAQGLSAMGFTPSDLHWGQTMQVWITPGLPTSFILWNSIYLQAELPLERRGWCSSTNWSTWTCGITPSKAIWLFPWLWAGGIPCSGSPGGTPAWTWSSPATPGP